MDEQLYNKKNSDFISLKVQFRQGGHTVIFLYATPNLWDKRRFICSSA